MKAVQQWDSDCAVPGSPSAQGVFDQVMWCFRLAFFRDDQDIARWDVQRAIAEPLRVDIGAIEYPVRSGSAFACLAADYQDADKTRIEGSPSFVVDGGRHQPYGNIGLRLLEANIQKLLRSPRSDEASWC